MKQSIKTVINLEVITYYDHIKGDEHNEKITLELKDDWSNFNQMANEKWALIYLVNGIKTHEKHYLCWAKSIIDDIHGYKDDLIK